MGPEFGTLLRGDHAELDRVLRAVGHHTSTDIDQCAALDAFRLGFAAHAEAEAEIVRALLDRVHAASSLYFLVAQTVAAHLSQESALAALAETRPGTQAWYDRATYLRELLRHHSEHEEACVIPALREGVSALDYAALAGAYATARLRALIQLPYATRTLGGSASSYQ